MSLTEDLDRLVKNIIGGGPHTGQGPRNQQDISPLETVSPDDHTRYDAPCPYRQLVTESGAHSTTQYSCSRYGIKQVDPLICNGCTKSQELLEELENTYHLIHGNTPPDLEEIL